MVHALVNMFGEDCILNESWPEPHHGSTLQGGERVRGRGSSSRAIERVSRQSQNESRSNNCRSWSSLSLYGAGGQRGLNCAGPISESCGPMMGLGGEPQESLLQLLQQRSVEDTSVNGYSGSVFMDRRQWLQIAPGFCRTCSS